MSNEKSKNSNFVKQPLPIQIEIISEQKKETGYSYKVFVRKNIGDLSDKGERTFFCRAKIAENVAPKKKFVVWILNSNGFEQIVAAEEIK